MRAACCLLLLWVLSLPVASPATAQDSGGLRLDVPATYYTMSEDPTRVVLPVVIDAGETPASQVQVEIDAGDVLGKVRISRKKACQETRRYVYRCRAHATEPRANLLGLEILGADKAAEPGASGVVRYTATAPGGRRATAETRMTAGSPQLRLNKLAAEGTRAGETLRVPVSVLNKGPITASSFVLEMLAGEGGTLTFAKRHRNCRYSNEGDRAYCVFDTPLEPGRAVKLAEPITFDRGAAETRAGLYVHAYAPGQDAGTSFNPDDFPLRGTAPELGVKRTGSTAGITQRAFSFQWIDTDQKVDLQAIGGDITGRPGDVTELELGVHNAGPGRITSRYFRFTVEPPRGTTLLPPPKPSPDPEGDDAAEWDCAPWETGARHYSCTVHSLSPGRSTTVPLRFRIDREDAGGGGTVHAVADKIYAHRDPERANDSARLTVNGKGGPAGSGGVSGAVVSAAGAAGVVVAAAAVPLVLRRRRRAEDR